MAALGIACLAVTAAVADPSGAREQAAPPSDVFAAGPGGLGVLDASTAGPEPERGSGTDAGSRAQVEQLPAGALVEVEDYVDPFLETVDLADLDGLEGLDGLDGLHGEDFLASPFLSSVDAGQMPAVTLRAYRAAAEVLAREQPGCGVDWALLAAIGRVESNHGRFGGATVAADGRSVPGILGVRLDGSLAGTMVIRDTDGGALDGDTVYDRAVGPMQFLPGTWARWGSDGDRDGDRDPQNINDAALAAARYLCSGDGGLDTPGPASVAVRRYNNSGEYVRLVLDTAAGYRDGGPAAFPDGAPSGYVPSSPAQVVYPGAPGWTPPARQPVLPFPPDSTSDSTSDVAPDPLDTDRSGRTPPAVSLSPAPSPSPSPSVVATPVPAGPSAPAPGPSASVSPTPSVTVSPTMSPTGRPSPSVSTEPTPGVTVSPTAGPTGVPSSSPTAAPTGSTTASPTTQPTATPAPTPAGEPTGTPTVPPSSTPGPAPTGPGCEPVPTGAPGATVEPDPMTSPTDDPTDPLLVCEPVEPTPTPTG